LLVQTDRGVILADNVVYATNAYTAALLPEFKNIIVPTRGQMMVTSPVKTEFQMPLWFNYGYEYVNQRLDKRLVAGGMRWVADGQESGVHDDSQVNRKVLG
jgi:glycine/D-amino acid oxidase-like deaminating enzyme